MGWRVLLNRSVYLPSHPMGNHLLVELVDGIPPRGCEQKGQQGVHYAGQARYAHAHTKGKSTRHMLPIGLPYPPGVGRE